MKRQHFLRAFAIATVASLGLALSASVVLADRDGGNKPAPVPFQGPVPKAHCGPADHTESGLQGETTEQERFSGDSERAYNCNLELVGEFRGEGAFSQDGPAYFEDCAYYGTDHNTPLQQHHGITVIDASDPTHPVASAFLDDTAAALVPHETVQTNPRSRLLVAAQDNGADFAVYDISDCRHPVLASDIQLQNSQGHMGAFAPDGRTYYLTDGRNLNSSTSGGFLHVVDLSDPSHARELPFFTFVGPGAAHGLEVNPEGFEPGVAEGTRVYAGQFGAFPFTNRADGLVIEDVSDYQFRRPNPQVRIISTLFWADSGGGEAMIPVKIKGHPYIISTDEAGGAGGDGGWAAACARGASAFGYPQIIDVADETHPKIISHLKLQVSDPANCSALLAETPPDAPGTAPGTNLPAISGTTNYSEETCVPDNPDNAKMMACGFQNAGLRVFDIHDPFHPSEIAYWKPRAVRTEVRPSSGSWAPGVDRTVDKIAHWVRWVRPDKGNGDGKHKGPREAQLWTVTDANGFEVLRFSDDFQARNKDLFEDSDN